MFDSALALNANLIYAYINKGYSKKYNSGNALRKLEKFNDAIQMYDQALVLNPYEEVIWTNKGNVLKYIIQEQH